MGMGGQCGPDILVLSDSNCLYRPGPDQKYLSFSTHPSMLGVAMEKTSEKKEKEMRKLEQNRVPSDKGLEKN